MRSRRTSASEKARRSVPGSLLFAASRDGTPFLFGATPLRSRMTTTQGRYRMASSQMFGVQLL
jgi:hypothetical protein